VSCLLFDLPPAGEERPRSKPKRQALAKEPVEAPQAVQMTGVCAPYQPALGVVEDAVCQSCHCGIWDVLEVGGGEILCQCRDCGMREWRKGAVKEEPRLPEGVYRGKTPAEVAATEEGREYLRMCAGRHRSDRVRKLCQEWVDAQSGTL